MGVPVTLNQGLGSKTGLVIARDAVTVDHDGVVEVRWSDSISDGFTKNQVRRRVEGRFGVAANQPSAVVKVATARLKALWHSPSQISTTVNSLRQDRTVTLCTSTAVTCDLTA